MNSEFEFNVRMDYYTDKVLAERGRSIIHDLKMIPYFNPKISHEAFIPTMEKVLGAFIARDHASTDIDVDRAGYHPFKTKVGFPKDIDGIFFVNAEDLNLWRKVRLLEDFCDVAEEKAAIQEKADREARAEAKRLKGLANQQKRGK